MKIRTQFVSNSSSSSFIVIEGPIKENVRSGLKIIDGELIIDENTGETEFDWQVEDYHDIGSR